MENTRLLKEMVSAEEAFFPPNTVDYSFDRPTNLPLPKNMNLIGKNKEIGNSVDLSVIERLKKICKYPQT